MFNKAIITIATLAFTTVTLASFSQAATTRTTKSDGGPTNSRSETTDIPVLKLNIKEPSDNYLWIRRHKSDSEISCKEGRLIVARQGFENVHTLQCQGRNFSYVALFDGQLRRVDVNRHGDIVGAWQF